MARIVIIMGARRIHFRGESWVIKKLLRGF